MIFFRAERQNNMKHLVAPQAEKATDPQRSGKYRRIKSYFYLSAALFMILLSAAGFGPSIIDRSWRNAPSTPLMMVHGIAVGAWLVLFLAQTILVAAGRTAVHRKTTDVTN